MLLAELFKPWARDRKGCTDSSDVARHEMILGIDLGTSFSTAAAWVNGRMYLVPDERGEPCIPSAVHFAREGPPVVGRPALDARDLDPENTVCGIKRLIGRDMESPEARVFAASTAVTLKAAPNGRAIVQTRKGDHTSEEIAGHVYRHLKQLSENRFQQKVHKAVLTIPASATVDVRTATIRAAQQAGLEIIDCIHEPSAAAVAFGLDRFRGQRRVLVFDFGGGTFDVTVLEQRDDDLKPMAFGGDPSLGGDDFDDRLAQHAASIVWRRHKVELQQDVVRWDRTLQRAEETKRALSAMPAARLRVRQAYVAGGRRHDLDLTISRTDIEPRWKELVDRSVKTTAETMVAAGLRPAAIDTLVLVGGTTYIPLVRDTITRVLSKPGQHPGDPQTAVACGAAVAAARIIARAA